MFIFLVLAEARKRCGLSDCVWLIVSSCKYVQALHLLPGRIVLLLLLSCRAQVYFRANVLWLEKVADTSMVLWMLLAGFDVIVWLHTLGRKMVAPVDFGRILWNSLAIPFARAIKIYQNDVRTHHIQQDVNCSACSGPKMVQVFRQSLRLSFMHIYTIPNVWKRPSRCLYWVVLPVRQFYLKPNFRGWNGSVTEPGAMLSSCKMSSRGWWIVFCSIPWVYAVVQMFVYVCVILCLRMVVWLILFVVPNHWGFRTKTPTWPKWSHCSLRGPMRTNVLWCFVLAQTAQADIRDYTTYGNAVK